MPEILRRHSLIISVIALLITAGQLMSASISNSAIPRTGAILLSSVISPIQELHHELILSGKRFWEHYVWLQHVETERNELGARLKELEAQNSRLIESDHENKRLKELLRFREETKIPGIAASVVGRDSSNWAKTVTLDRGAQDGLRSGLPVVDGNAIVGQVISVDWTSAKVLLISDNSSAVDSIVQNSRAPGMVEGLEARKLQLRYVLKDHPVTTGERVIASGLDGVFPKGTLIGVVTKVDPATNGLFQNIELQPSVDLNRLETVLVLLDTKPRPSAVETSQVEGVGGAEESSSPSPLASTPLTPGTQSPPSTTVTASTVIASTVPTSTKVQTKRAAPQANPVLESGRNR